MPGPTGKQGQRLDMLINVAVQGDKKLKKLATEAKRVAVESKNLGKGLDVLGKSMAEMKGDVKSTQDAIKELGIAEKNLVTAEEKLAKVTFKNGKLMKGTAENVKKLRSERDELRLVMVRERNALKQLSGINIQLTKTTKKIIGGTKTLRVAKEELTNILKVEINEMKALARAEKKETSAKKKATKATKRQTKENVKQAKSFNALSQRVNNAAEGWHKWRRVLGSVRNILLVVAFATRGLTQAFQKAFTATVKLEAAMRGLSSVAVNMGIASTQARDAAMSLAKDGLLTVEEAAAGLKNLLATGMGMQEATQMMQTFTDAAAFNRQGTLGLGEAVVGATQGIKNQNSIMVDNAGITKNLSIMQKEYAAAIGTTIGKLTEQEKKQAIINGVLREGALFAGDSQKVLTTLSGTMAQLSAQTFTAAAAVGDVLNPAITKLVKLYTEGMKAVQDYFAAHKIELIESFSSAMGKLTKIMRGTVAVVSFLASGIGWILEKMAALGAPAGSIVKTIVILKVWRIVMKKLSYDMTDLAAKMHITTGRVRLWDTANKKFVMGLKTIIPLFRLTRAELIATAGGMGVFKNTLKAVGYSLAGLKVALIGTRAALVALKASLGPFILLWIAMEVVIKGMMWAFDKLSNKSFKRAEKAGKSMRKELRLDIQAWDKLNSAMMGIQSRGAAAGARTGQFSAALNKLKDHQDKITSLKDNFAASRKEARQEELREQLEDEQKMYELSYEALRLAQKKLQTETQNYHDRLAQYQSSYDDTMKERYKDANVDEVIDYGQRYRSLIDTQRQFDMDMTTLAQTDAGNAKLQTEMREVAMLNIKSGILATTFKAQARHNDKMETLFEKLDSLRVRGEIDTMEAIQQAGEATKAKLINDLKATVEATRAHFNALSSLNKNYKKQQQAELARAMQTEGAGGLGMEMISGGALGGVGQADLDKIKEYIGTMKKGGEITQAMVFELEDLKTGFQQAGDEARKSGSDDELYFGNLFAAMEKIVPSARSYLSLQQLMGIQGTALKTMNEDLTKTYEEQVLEIGKVVDANTAKKLSEEQYRKDLKDNIYKAKAQQLKDEIALQETLNIIGAATLVREAKLAELNRRGITGWASIVPIYAGFVEIQAKHMAQSMILRDQLEMERVGREKTIRDLTTEKEVYDKLIETWELSGKAKTQTIIDAEKESAALQQQISLAREGKIAFEETAEAKKKALASEQTAAFIELEIEYFTKYTAAANKMYAGWLQIKNNTAKEKRAHNREYAKLLSEGRINEEQEAQLQAASADYRAAKEKYEMEKMRINLIKNIASQVMAWAALHAAKYDPVTAGIILAAAAVGTFIATKYAADLENKASREFEKAEEEFNQRKAEIMPDEAGAEGDAQEAKKFGGTIKAESLTVSISPTIVIQGEQVFIGQGSVSEFSAEMHSLITTMTQEAIENRDLDVSALSGLSAG